MNLSKKEMSSLPLEAVENAKEAGVTAVDLSKNFFSQMPSELKEIMPHLFEFNMAGNRLTQAESWISMATNLQYLNLGNNKLSDLPEEIGSLQHLREIALPFNKFDHIPYCIFNCERLETLIMTDNQIGSIDITGLSRLKMLAILDLQNNNIQQVSKD